MASGKRRREPDEAPELTKKHHHVQKKSQIPGPVPPPNPRENDEVETGRPGPPSSRVLQAGSHHSPSVQLPSELSGQGARRRPKLKLNPPRPQNQPGPSQAVPTGPGSSHSETSTCYSQNVAEYDVETGVEAVGSPKTDDLENWGSVDGVAEFISSKSGLEGDWVGVKPLGKGGNGMAGLWELRDGDGRSKKKMVIKEETCMKNKWNKNKYLREVPQEVKIMSILNKTNCHAIPRLFNYKRYPIYCKHRMYMEYCPFKDLSALCQRYRRFRQYLPEPFLWDTFYHLVEAAVAMRDGPEEDLEIVHRDIKPRNIFLGDENEDKGFAFYPVAKTGDFGLAVITNPTDRKNPRRYQDFGTDGYFAPEQQSQNHLPKKKQRLSSRTNVWAIGATMFELLTLYKHIEYLKEPKLNVDGMIVPIKTNKEPEYSKNLRELIEDCLKPDPSNRIRLDNLQVLVEYYRNRIRESYEQSNDKEKARFEFYSFLYYVKNEINNMPTGTWENYSTEPKSEGGKFTDPKYKVEYPRFGESRDAEREGSDDGDDADAKGGTFPSGQPRAKDGSSHNGVASNRRLSDGRRLRNGGLDDATSQCAARDDGGIEGLEDSLTDGQPDGTDDESRDMESESDDPASPSPSDVQAPPAPAPQAPLQPQPQDQAPEFAPRRLRNGTTVAYF